MDEDTIPNSTEHKGSSVEVVIPIYKTGLDELEFLSISHSLKKLSKYGYTFIFPQGLDTSFYTRTFENPKFISFPKEFFYSRQAYNQLCYETEFYRIFEQNSHILILQPDAIVINPEKLEFWCKSDYDFVGAPDDTLYSYDIRSVPPFNTLMNYLKPITLQGLNGGLSLRRVSKIIESLEEYPELTKFFRSYVGGIGEDIFFSVLGRVTKGRFRIPTDFLASNFALTINFQEWIKFNLGELPFGFHDWYRTSEDRDFVMRLLTVGDI